MYIMVPFTIRTAKYAGLSTPHDVWVACSRLRDSRARRIEKAPIFARPTLSRLPHYLRAWNRLISGAGLFEVGGITLG